MINVDPFIFGVEERYLDNMRGSENGFELREDIWITIRGFETDPKIITKLHI